MRSAMVSTSSDLLAVMLVEQKMKLVESGSGDLPVRFLVQIAQGHGVGQKLVEVLGHFQTDGLFQFQRQGVAYGAVFLDFSSSLVKVGLGGNAAVVARGFLGHRNSPL